MKVLFSFLFVFISAQAQAVELSPKTIRGMSYNKLQKIRYAYVSFLERVEKDTEMQSLPLPKKTTYKSFSDFFIATAYAVSPDGNLCFFGGWPSKMQSGKCRSPWNSKGDEKVKSLGGYESKYVCADTAQVRCNPLLFGRPTDSPEGYCVTPEPKYRELTHKCEEVSRDQIPQIIEGYKKNPESFLRFTKEVKTFCDSYQSYDACDDLAKRIKEINGKDISSGTKESKDQNPDPLTNSRPGVGNALVNQCQKFIKNDNDVKGRDILGSFQSASCELDQKINGLAELEPIAKTLNMRTAMTNLNEESFELNLEAYLANAIKFQPNHKLSLGDEEELYKEVLKKYPNLFAGENYKKAFARIYKKLDQEVKNEHLIPIDQASTGVEFDELSKNVNAVCAKIRDAFVKKYPQQSYWQDQRAKVWDTDEEESFYGQFKEELYTKVDGLLSGATIGHLTSTNYFKENVFDPSSNPMKECARNPSYQMIKNPVNQSDINAGHREIEKKLAQNLEQINRYDHGNRKGSEATVEAIFKEYLKNDAGVVNLALQKLDATTQKSLGAAICLEVDKIYRSDKNWRVTDFIVGGAGSAAGLVLIATGIGSPLGVALTAASLGLAGIEATRAIANYKDAESRQSGIDVALAQRREETKKYLDQSQEVSSEERQAIVQGGLAAVGSIRPIKLLFQASKGSEVAAAAPKLLISGPKAAQAIEEGASHAGHKALNSGVKALEQGAQPEVQGARKIAGSATKVASNLDAKKLNLVKNKFKTDFRFTEFVGEYESLLAQEKNYLSILAKIQDPIKLAKIRPLLIRTQEQLGFIKKSHGEDFIDFVMRNKDEILKSY